MNEDEVEDGRRCAPQNENEDENENEVEVGCGCAGQDEVRSFRAFRGLPCFILR
jgi:hypothetical protein